MPPRSAGIGNAAERQHEGGGEAKVAARRSAGRFVFCSVIFITSVIVSEEACSGANAC